MNHTFTFLSFAAVMSMSAWCAAATGIDPPPPTADALFVNGDFTNASVAYAAVLREHPDDAAANAGVARIESYRRHADAALRYARAALAVDSGNVIATDVVTELTKERDDAARTYRIVSNATEADLPFLQTDPLPMISVTIDGREAHVILDTGGPGLDLSAAFAAKAGIVATKERAATFAGGRSAMVHEGALVHTLVAGAVTVHDIPAGIAPVPGPDVDGVIGTGFLAHFLATIDYAHARLVLRPVAAAHAFESASESAGASIVPMYLVPDHFIFAPVRIDDAPEALFGVDTGGPMIGVDLSAATFAAAKISPDATHDVTLMGGGGAVSAHAFTVPAVQVGRTIVRNVPGISIAGNDQRSPFPFAVAGRLSHEFFRHTAVTFDFAAMKLVISNDADAQASTPETSRTVALAAAAELERGYVFPAKAREAANRARANAASGAYDALSETALAGRLTADFASVMHDKHVRVRYSESSLPPGSPSVEFERDAGYGLGRVAHLPGNVGYLDVRLFPRASAERDLVFDGMVNAVAHSDAVILDLRRNHGGDPDAVARLLSHFLAPKTHLNDFIGRGDGDENVQSSTFTSVVPGPRIAAPLYVLTSAETFSGGEECAYDLKALGRGTVVGEITGGGANPGRPHRIGDRFDIFVPDARARNPITKSNWEGVGVLPDVTVPRDRALATAYATALGERDDDLHARLATMDDATILAL